MIYFGVDIVKYMELFKLDVEIIGKIFDKEDEVKDEFVIIDYLIVDFKKKVEKFNKNGFVIMVNDGKISVFGFKLRYGLIYDVFGVILVDKNIKVFIYG